MAKRHGPRLPEETRSRRALRRERPRVPLWRLLLILLCLLGFWAFFVPLFGHILNIANLSAMAGFLLLAAVFLWWPGFLRLLRRLWVRRWGKVLLLAAGFCTGTLVLTLLVLSLLVTLHIRDVPKEPCPTLIVLGCQVRGTTPSLLLSKRIQAAADYLTEHPETVAVLSGGQGPGEDISEAACMYQGLLDRGIAPERIYLEDESHNTVENLRFSKALMGREGLREPVAIVSNGFHIYRALRIAEDLGFSAQGLATRTMWYSLPTYVLREAMALVKYVLTK